MSPNQKIRKREKAEAGSKHHKPMPKPSTRSRCPTRQQEVEISQDPSGNHRARELSH